jgi:hypothetical protein
VGRLTPVNTADATASTVMNRIAQRLTDMR